MNIRAASVLGHASIVAGCLLFTWGIYLIPVSEPTITGILSKPLFWGMFAILGGICANLRYFRKSDIP